MKSKKQGPWKDDELSYCIGLVSRRGSGAVPRAAIADYLRVQAASARKDGRLDLVEAFQLAAVRVDMVDWTRAFEILDEARLTLPGERDAACSCGPNRGGMHSPDCDGAK